MQQTHSYSVYKNEYYGTVQDGRCRKDQHERSILISMCCCIINARVGDTGGAPQGHGAPPCREHDDGSLEGGGGGGANWIRHCWEGEVRAKY
jgi:hypothetical protein